MAKLTWNDVEEKIEHLGWKVNSRESNGNLYQIDISQFSPAGQDCNFTLQCEKNNPSSVVKAFKELYENYDPEAETMLWVDSDGHGKNGAPYHLSDVLKDMESVEEMLEESSYSIDYFVNNFDIVLSKDDVRKKFLSMIAHINGYENIEAKYAINLCKQAVDAVINHDVGSPREKKASLNKYLKEIGITDSKPETYAAVLNREIKENRKSIEQEELKSDCKNGVLVTTKPMMSSTEVKVHKMFDQLFNNSETNPVEYAKFVLDASSGAVARHMKGEMFWAFAVDHAVNSGGALWQSSAERVQLMEKAGLIVNTYEEPNLYGPCYDSYKAYMKINGAPEATVNFIQFVEEIFPNKTVMTEYLQSSPNLLKEYRTFDEKKEDYLLDKYNDSADKMYGTYMHMYLKDLGVLDNKARDRKIADYEKKQESSRSR